MRPGAVSPAVRTGQALRSGFRSVLDPVSGEEQPERETRLGPYRRNRRSIVASATGFLPDQPRVRRTGPRSRISREFRPSVIMMWAAAYGPDPGKASSAARARRRGAPRRRPTPRLEIDRPPVDRDVPARSGTRRGIRRGPRLGRRSRAPRPSPPGSGRRSPSGPVAARPRVAERSRSRSPSDRGAPRAVRRADRLHDVFEHGGRAQHPARAGRCPGEVGVVRDERRRSSRGPGPCAARGAAPASAAAWTRGPAAGPSMSTRALPARPGPIRMRRGRPLGNPAPSSRGCPGLVERRPARGSAKPCEFKVRARSTGSPRGPRSGSRSDVVTGACGAARSFDMGAAYRRAVDGARRDRSSPARLASTR